MARHGLLPAVGLLLLMGATPALPEATGSLLTIVSRPDLLARSGDAPQVAVDQAGRVLVVYKAKAGDAKIQPYSALLAGGSWQSAAVPMPALTAYPESLMLAGLVGGTARQGFDLLASHYGKLFHWQWLNGTWSPAELVAGPVTGLASKGLARRTSGELVIVAAATRFHLYRKQAAKWQDIQLPTVVAQHSLNPVFPDLSGVLYLLGSRRGVPIVTALPTKADPAQLERWVTKPPGESTAWTVPYPVSATDLQLAFDCPHQLLYAAWKTDEQPHVAWAPLGATTAGQWRQADIPVPAHAAGVHFRLESNGHGGVGLLVLATAGGKPALNLHWLSDAGPGGAVPLLRPGTQTEAAAFTSVDGDSLSFCIDDGGTAHIAVAATKRGEVPASTKRVYYATVTGGGTATSGPQVAGGGATTGDEGGPKPDFAVSILSPKPQGQRLHVSSESHERSEHLAPLLAITNRGAQYFGDLTLQADIDGAVVRVRIPDESHHQTPLFLRGQKREFYLPEVAYQYEYREGAHPPPLRYDYGQRQTRLLLYTGLGRKRMTVTVDPDQTIDEADRQNNTAQVEYVLADGHAVVDRARGANNQSILGLNDLGLLGAPRLRGNTRLLKPGYVQRPTELDVTVDNPRLAGPFPSVLVVVTLDGKELSRQTAPLLGRTPNLRSAYLGQTIIYQKPPPKPDISGSLHHIPIDLTHVAEGDHVLRVEVDPEDQYADLRRDNNVAELRFRVRSPGGTLRIHVNDFTDPHPPVARACLVLTNLWADWTNAAGTIEIADVPKGSYDAHSLSADRLEEEPRYFTGYAPAFTLADNQVRDVTITCERALNVSGDVTVAGSGRFLDDDYVEALLRDAELFVPGGSTGHHYRIENVPPGQHTIVCGAYGYQTKETSAQCRRSSATTDDCTVNVALVDGPRATVSGTVQEQDGKALAGATVWLPGAPRAAETDATGHFQLSRVAAGSGYTLWAQAADHTTESATTGTLAGGQNCVVGPIKLAHITRKFASIDFDSTTWAICEQSTDAGGIPAFKVDTKFGAFRGALGLMYHSTAGQTQITADQILLWIQGGDLIQGGVSTEIGLSDFTGVEMDDLQVGIMAPVLKGIGSGFTVLDGVNKLADFLSGNVDPSMLQRNDKIVATYTTHTNTPYKQDPLIDMPMSTDIPVGMSFRGGGETVVRVDEIEVRDAAGHSKTIAAEWYSPGYAAYRVAQAFDGNTIEVRIKAAVLNNRRESGILGTASKNLIDWKPLQTRWLRISGFNY